MAVRRSLTCLVSVWTFASVYSAEIRYVRQINDGSVIDGQIDNVARGPGLGIDSPDKYPKDTIVPRTGGDSVDSILPDRVSYSPEDDNYKPKYRQNDGHGRSKATKCVEYDHDTCKNENRKCGDTIWCGLNGQEPLCFALWHNKSGELLLKKKGCWLPTTAGECMQQQCLHTKPRPNLEAHPDGPIFFCCCNETLCNTQYRFEVNENDVFNHKHLSDYGPVVSGRGSVPAGGSLLWPMVLFCIILVMMALIVGAIIYYAAMRRRVNGKSSSIWSSGNSNQRRRVNNEVGQRNANGPASEMHQRNPLLDQHDAHDDEDAENLNSLELCDRIAKSRYSEVWLGKFIDKTTGDMQRCAVKVVLLSDKAIGDNETQIYRYVRQFEHANILRFLGKRLTELPNAEFRLKLKPQLQIVTEYHAHGSLLSYLKSNALDVDAALNIVTNMVEGLSFLHFERRGGKPIIAHRDFKSSNVLLKDNMDACISDFGLAAVFFDGEDIRSHEQVGTDRYMAPELLDGAISKTREAFLHIDMYACGLVTWEVLSRTKMHADDHIPPYKMPLEAELAEYDNNNNHTNGAVFDGNMLPAPRDGDEKQKLIRKLTQAVVHDKKRPVKRPEWDGHDMIAEAWRTAEQSLDSDPEGRPSAALWLSRLRGDGMHNNNSSMMHARLQNSFMPYNMPIEPVINTVDANNCYAAGYPPPPSSLAPEPNTGYNMLANTLIYPTGSNGFINVPPQPPPRDFSAQHNNNIMPLPYYQGYAFGNHQRPNLTPSDTDYNRVAAAAAAAVIDASLDPKNSKVNLSPCSTIRTSTLPDLVCAPQSSRNQAAVSNPAANPRDKSHHYYNDIVTIDQAQQRQKQLIPNEIKSGESPPPPPLPPRAPAKSAYG